MRTLPGVEGFVLDVAIASRLGKDACAQYATFPAALVAAAAELGLELDLSIHAVSDTPET